MPNMSNTKNAMPTQSANERNKNFNEVALGYTAEMAVVEANRCLQCKNPRCQKSCPISTPIPIVIQLYKEKMLNQ